jgi:hypothetical protein
VRASEKTVLTALRRDKTCVGGFLRLFFCRFNYDRREEKEPNSLSKNFDKKKKKEKT